MNLVERDGWIYVRLQASERSSDVDWDELIRWKIPQGDRIHVPDIDAWVIRSEHESLIKDVYFIYQAASSTEADTRYLAKAQEAIEQLDGLQPHERRKLDAGLEVEWQTRNGVIPRWNGMYQVSAN